MRFPTLILPWLALTLTLAPMVRAQPARKAEIRELASTRVEALLGSIEKDADFARVSRSLDALFDELIAYAPDREREAFRNVAFARRLIDQLSKVKKSRLELFTFLRANPQLARTLAFLVQDADKVDAVYGVLESLRAKYGKDLNRLASLTAALCVVHDRPRTIRINENSAKMTDPVQLFGYFRKHEKQMFFAPADMPAELLICVVDASVPVTELEWALARYGGDGRVGRRYHDIRYDTHAFRTGEEKKLTANGFNLPNILKYGGICADQSYYAQQVGKALGIPTAGISGMNASMAHAWVGFFEVVAGTPRWNFDSGHYDEYKDVRGGTIDPQTGQGISDSWLALNLDASTGGAANRQTAIALLDAAERIKALQRQKRYPPTGETVIPVRTPARPATLESRLDFLEAALRLCPTLTPGWSQVTGTARDLSLKQKQYWAEVLYNLCGDKYPDFTLSVAIPLVEAVTDTGAQDAMWKSLAKTYQKRPDLVARIRFAQGSMWEKATQPSKAWDAYQDVCVRFTNDTPYAVFAAIECDRLLRGNKKDGDVAPMYADLWRRAKRPSASLSDEIKKQSNWHRLGSLYQQALELAGDLGKSQQVQRDLDR